MAKGKQYGVFSLVAASLLFAGCDVDGQDESARQGLAAGGLPQAGDEDPDGSVPPQDTGEEPGETGDGPGEPGDDPNEPGEPGCDSDTGHDSGEQPGGDGDACPGVVPFDLQRLEEFTPSDEQVIVDCDTPAGYEVDSWRALQAGDEQLYVMGVYQTRGDHSGNNHPMGAGSVTWSRGGDNVLVLAAYEPTTWSVELTDGGELSRIIALGYHQQIVQAPEGIEIEIHSYEQGGCFECGYALPGEGGGCEGEDLVAVAEALSGRTLTAFDGCYDATTMVY